MSPRLERELAMDEMAEHAQQFGRSHIPDLRAPTRFVPNVLVGSHRGMSMEPANEAPTGFEALEELTFQQLLDLQDEASEDDSLDLFNDVARELRDRRMDGKVALVKVFVEACNTHGRIPMVTGGQIVPTFICDYLREALSTNDGVTWGIDMVMHPNGRERAVAAMAQEYVNECAEDILRAGWSE